MEPSREPTPTSQQGTRTGPEVRGPQLAPQHPWERAIQTVVEDTPPLIDNVYHRLAGDHPPGMAPASQQDLLDHWWTKLYAPNGTPQPTPDPEALAELYTRASGDELKSLIAALRARERERLGPPTGSTKSYRP